MEDNIVTSAAADIVQVRSRSGGRHTDDVRLPEEFKTRLKDYNFAVCVQLKALTLKLESAVAAHVEE